MAKRSRAVREQHDALLRAMHDAPGRMSLQEMAEALGVCSLTVQRDRRRLGLSHPVQRNWLQGVRVPPGYVLPEALHERLPAEVQREVPVFMLTKMLQRRGVPYQTVPMRSRSGHSRRHRVVFLASVAHDALAAIIAHKLGHHPRLGDMSQPPPDERYISIRELQEVTDRQHLSVNEIEVMLARYGVRVQPGGHVLREAALQVLLTAPRWSDIRRPGPLREAVIADLQRGDRWREVAERHGAEPLAVRRLMYYLRTGR
jgi:hypothetical protein